MEVALESPPLGIGGGNEPGARCPDLSELRPNLSRQTLVLEHESRSRSNGLHERRLVEQHRIVDERGDLFTLRGDERDRAVWAAGKLERLTGGVDIPAVVEPIRDIQRRVAEHPGEALTEAGCPFRPKLDYEVGRLPSTQPRPTDPSDDSERNQQSDSATNRLEGWGTLTGRGHPRQPEDGRRDGERGAHEQWRLRASRGPLKEEQPRYDEHEYREGHRQPEDSLHPCDHVGHGLPRSKREHVPRVGEQEGSDELTSERRRVPAGDHDPSGTRPGTPVRIRQHKLDEERRPHGFEEETGRPQGVAVSLLHLRSAASEREGGGGEHDSRATPARTLQRATRDRPVERPRQRVDGDARARHARVAPEPADDEARAYDRGDEEHRVTEHAPSRRGGEGRRSTPSLSTRAANAAADSLDLGMKPRAPQASIRRP